MESLVLPRCPAAGPHTVGPRILLEQHRVGCRTMWPEVPRAGRSCRIQSLHREESERSHYRFKVIQTRVDGGSWEKIIEQLLYASMNQSSCRYHPCLSYRETWKDFNKMHWRDILTFSLLNNFIIVLLDICVDVFPNQHKQSWVKANNKCAERSQWPLTNKILSAHHLIPSGRLYRNSKKLPPAFPEMLRSREWNNGQTTQK